MKPWLTVVMPVHNGATFLGATLASVARGDTAGIQFRIYNSANDGGSAKRVADSFADQLAIIWQDRLDVPSWQEKTNIGVREAITDHVAMLHQDDLWLPGHVEAARRMIEQDHQAVLSVSATRFADADGRLIGNWRLPARSGAISEDDFLQALLVQNSIAIPTPIVRRDAWLAVGGIDPELWYTGDWDLYLKLSGQGRVVVRDEVSTAFRLHGGSLTMTGRHDGLAFRGQLEQVLERHLHRISPRRRARVERRARASIEVNCALAGASVGEKGAMIGAALRLIRLGPTEMARYIRQSRIVDRLLPRVRLAVSGNL